VQAKFYFNNSSASSLCGEYKSTNNKQQTTNNKQHMSSVKSESGAHEVVARMRARLDAGGSVRISSCWTHPALKRQAIAKHQAWRRKHDVTSAIAYRVCECAGDACLSTCAGESVFSDATTTNTLAATAESDATAQVKSVNK
jgi:hypothetical protein